MPEGPGRVRSINVEETKTVEISVAENDPAAVATVFENMGASASMTIGPELIDKVNTTLDSSSHLRFFAGTTASEESKRGPVTGRFMAVVDTKNGGMAIFYDGDPY